jgi:hypothetical protein
MSRSAKIWFGIATVFALINLAGAAYAAVVHLKHRRRRLVDAPSAPEHIRRDAARWTHADQHRRGECALEQTERRRGAGADA